MTRSDVGKGHPQYYQDMAERIAARDARRVLRQSVRQPGQSARARDDHRRRRSGSRPDGRRRRDRLRRRLGRHDHRAVALLRPRGAAGRDGAGRSGRLGARRLRRDRHRSARPDRGWSRASARTSCRRSPICRACRRAYTIPDRESARDRARAAAQRGHPRPARQRHAGRRGAALLPRADAAEARGHVRLRHRQQVPVEDVQRLLDGRPGSARPAGVRRSARPDRAHAIASTQSWRSSPTTR